MRDDVFSEESDTSCQREHESTWWTQTNEHDGIWPSTVECRWLPRTLTRALKKFSKDLFVPKVFETSKIWFSLKIAAVQDYWQWRSVEKERFSWFTLHWSWLFLCVSLVWVFVLSFSLQRVENKLRCTSWCDASFRASQLFPFLPCPCGLSFLRAQGRALCILQRHCMDRSAQR